MSSRKISKSKVITSIVIVIFIIGIIYLLFFNKSEKLSYYTVKAKGASDNILIEDYKDFNKIYKSNRVEEVMTNKATYKKDNVIEYFNEEYFNNKKLAIISLYEDTTRSYIYSVNEVTYNKDKTEATIKYTYKTDGYAGTLKDSWYTYMFVELEKSVESVVFQIDNEIDAEK